MNNRAFNHASTVPGNIDERVDDVFQRVGDVLDASRQLHEEAQCVRKRSRALRAALRRRQ
jgi:hypothetical protein